MIGSFFALYLLITPSPGAVSAAAGGATPVSDSVPPREGVSLELCAPVPNEVPGPGAAAPVAALTSLRRLLSRPAPAGVGLAERSAGSASRWTDLSLLANAVVDAEVEDLCAPLLARTPAVARRDREAYALLSVGYSAREVADIVSGRITRGALDQARYQLMAGRAPALVADYLDARYAAAAEAAPRPGDVAASPGTASARAAAVLSPGLLAVIDRSARSLSVDVRLVHAVMAAESGFDAAARSPVGAIGLMQLMPLTARALGVDPHQPEQNVEGGVRYLAQLLRQFADVNTALIAYNAGPGYAQRYRQRQVPLYGETRAYLARVQSLLAH